MHQRHQGCISWKRAGVLVLAAAAAPLLGCAASGEEGYGSPEAAVEALVGALRSGDPDQVRAVLGPEGEELLDSGDEVADRLDREAFLRSYDERHALLAQGDEAVLVVGGDEWPLPIPLVRADGDWRFDLERGQDEILARRIGRNELATIEVCRAIVDAQNEYAAADRDGRGPGAYASRFLSTSGARDGLYWPAADGEPESPLGPLVAEAAAEGYARQSAASEERQPYHGYYYRMLTAQGSAAPGGSTSYWVDGRLTGGFAVLAEPASYGNSGVMTFLVGPSGIVYERDLGPETGDLAGSIQEFSPDASWAVVRE